MKTLPSRNSSEMTERLKQRSKEFARRGILLCRALPRTAEGKILGAQLLRSASSVGANYRAVCRARSRKEFISKLGTVIEECDETLFWLEMVLDLEMATKPDVAPLHAEGNELLSIFVAARRTAQSPRG